ncbi:methyl-accepting chemotaxis protein [Geomesophilobacter sediminis]|uniref:Methyl-accepting chemotaxis protein n=1 Tax=Geomesophilobacter sediminis TaxID=2798584 RepID=A0A8J7JBQ5_9BACT|nr:methyl-accepting chemotaxis protein [Geomesophilobacter sediminis]MBJ6724626.1 methyl-accepting chemotaxis protein [Geomesophilobacter sediminis]
MKWNDIKMRGKLLVLASVGVIALVLVGAMGTFDLRRLNVDLRNLNQNIENVTKFSEMKERLLLARLDVVYMMSLQDVQKVQEKKDDYEKQVARIHELSKDVERINLDGGEKGLVATFKEGSEAYDAQARKLSQMLLEAHRSGNRAALVEAINFGSEQVAPLYKKPAEAIEALHSKNIKESNDIFLTADHTAQTKVVVNIVIIIAAAGVSLLIALVIANGLTKALQQVFSTMERIADGDLTARSTIKSRDEMGMLGNEMNAMAEKLTDIIKRLSGNSLSVSSAAVQMNATAEQMATSTEQLASQASTIATACEEMAATSSDIARNCHAAANDSSKANDAAMAGTKVVEQTVTVMERISSRVRSTAQTVESLGARSDQIGEIIGTIEDIADQTNLLALNAAIEAARAGEQGRGFAVVADEVRALAERTTKATREIGEMIKSIQAETRNAVSAMDEGVREVENGTMEASRSGEALQHILEQIANVTSQVNQIAVAAEEQTAVTVEINNNIQQITDVANLSSQSSHEEAAAAHQLAALSEDLKNMVEQFRYA